VGENKVCQNNLTSGAGITQNSLRHSYQIAAIKAKIFINKFSLLGIEPIANPNNFPASLLLTINDPINSYGS
jgi:hypothetical protein